MRFNPPKKLTFWITVVLAALGLIGTFVTIPFVSAFAFWFVLVAYIVLAASLFVKGM
jgi:heme/copper-type cytochrome/quinol oxidase subunit 1